MPSMKRKVRKGSRPANIVRMPHGPVATGPGRHARPCRPMPAMTLLLDPSWASAGKGRNTDSANGRQGECSSDERGMGVDGECNVYTVWSPLCKESQAIGKEYTSGSW